MGILLMMATNLLLEFHQPESTLFSLFRVQTVIALLDYCSFVKKIYDFK